jgi:hypothetical protein
MTKKQAVARFEAVVLPAIKMVESTHLRPIADVPMRRRAWCGFVDGLCRDHQITEYRAKTWTVPSKILR